MRRDVVWNAACNFVQLFVLVFFRTAGLMLARAAVRQREDPAAREGDAGAGDGGWDWSNRVTDPAAHARRQHANSPPGIGGEMIFGLVMGLGLSLDVHRDQWAGEIIGQQMGFNLGGDVRPAVRPGRIAGGRPLLHADAGHLPAPSAGTTR